MQSLGFAKVLQSQGIAKVLQHSFDFTEEIVAKALQSLGIALENATLKCQLISRKICTNKFIPIVYLVNHVEIFFARFSLGAFLGRI